jgi:hypothetical protein
VVERIVRERERDGRLGRNGGGDSGPIEREGYLEREHAVDFEAGNPSEYDREVRAKTLDRPEMYSNEPGVVELPYDEETWRGLLVLKRAIDELYGKVEALIGRADFRDQLRRFALGASAQLLSAPGD